MTVTTYRKRAGYPEADADADAKKVGAPMPCTFCNDMTAHETLLTLGARCVGCYRAYCEQQSSHPDVGDKRDSYGGGPKAWAYRLREREQQGDRLSGAQRAMWREAIEPHGRADDQAQAA